MPNYFVLMPILMLKWMGSKVGIHDGHWVYDSAEQCNQRRTCRDCGNQWSREKHQVSLWNRVGALVETGTCDRCGQTDSRVPDDNY